MYFLFTHAESDLDSYKPLKVFIEQSMPIPKTVVLPLGVEVPSYCRSILKGDMQLIEKARSEKKDINVTSNNTPRCLLHYGVFAKVPEEEKYRNLKKLVDLGADREQRDKHGRTPLHFAVLLGDTKAVDVLLEAGCDTTAKCHDNNLMHLATISGDPDMFHKVRELGFDPCSPTEYGFTSMHLAALYNQHQLIPLLKHYGVDVNRCSEAETTALHLHQAVMMLDLGQKLSPTLLDVTPFQSYVLQNIESQSTRTAITCVIDYYGDVQAQTCAQELLQFEDRDAKLHPLICATMLGFSQTVKVLVDLGADTNCLYANLTPLYWSAAIGHLELVKYFFFKCKSESSSNSNLLWLPVISGAADVVEFLVENIMILVHDNPDSEFDSANLVDVAAIMNRPEILKFALEMEHKGVFQKSLLCEDPNKILQIVLLLASVMNIITKTIPALAPVLAVTKERQSQVVSTIVDVPGYDPLQAISTEGDVALTLLDSAIFLSQPVAVDIILNDLKQKRILPKHTVILKPGSRKVLSFFHVCVLSPYFVAFSLRVDLPLNYIIDDLKSTCDTLVKYGYDINSPDCNGCTCLDYAIALDPELTDIVDFLRSRGACTSGDRQALEVENKKLKSEVKGLVKKLVEVEKRNQELKLQNENLSRKMDVILKHLSPLAPFLNPGSNPPTPSTFLMTNPSPAVTVATPLPTMPVTTKLPSVPVSMRSHPVPDDTPTNPLLTTPTLHQLNRLIIRQIALDWYSVGLHLEIEVVNLQIIEEDIYPPSVEKCCRTMFTKWLSHDEGTGGAPRLWRTVLKALKNARYNTVVEDVERELFEQNQ